MIFEKYSFAGLGALEIELVAPPPQATSRNPTISPIKDFNNIGYSRGNLLAFSDYLSKKVNYQTYVNSILGSDTSK